MIATRPNTIMVQWNNGALENEICLFWGSISTEPRLLEKKQSIKHYNLQTTNLHENETVQQTPHFLPYLQKHINIVNQP